MRKIPVALFSLEMSNVQLVNRMIVNVCEIPGEKIKSGQLAPYEWGQLDYKIKELYDAPMYVDDTPSLSVFELRTKARRLVRELCDRRNTLISLKEIVSVESDAHYINIGVVSGLRYRTRMTIAEFLKLADNDTRFIPVNRGNRAECRLHKGH